MPRVCRGTSLPVRWGWRWAAASGDSGEADPGGLSFATAAGDVPAPAASPRGQMEKHKLIRSRSRS